MILLRPRDCPNSGARIVENSRVIPAEPPRSMAALLVGMMALLGLIVLITSLVRR